MAALLYAASLLNTMVTWRSNRLDFSHYYVSSLMMRQGADPYLDDIKPVATSLGLDVRTITLATYPPTFLLCFEPLTLLDPLPAYYLWSVINIAALALTIYLLFDGLSANYKSRVLLLGLVVFYPPITDNFFWAQTQILMLLAIVLFMRWLESGRPALAGAILGLAGLLKIFPLLLVVYLLLRRQWKALCYVVLVIAIGGIVTLGFVGVDRSINFLTSIPTVTSQHWLGRMNNVALVAIISHLFWYPAAHHIGPLAGLAANLSPGLEMTRRVVVALAQLAVFALTIYATLKSSRLSDDGDEHVIALWVVATVLLAPTAWVHYLTLFLLPYAILLRLYLRGEAPHRAASLGLASFVVGELLIVVNLLGLLRPTELIRDITFWATLIGWPMSMLLGFAAISFLAIGAKSRPSFATADNLKASRAIPA
ncbi:MAG TPA: glycosyltransferase family 87 protein [Candidatus Binataceae bacterium]|nr:glycosyltransferase family 87 protein [Candidatus Binataceae bacterium]